MSDNKQQPRQGGASKRELAVLDQLLDDLKLKIVKVYRSLTGQPFIETDFKDPSDQAVPPIRQSLNSRDARAWLMVYSRIRCGQHLMQWEASRLLDHLI